MIASYIDLKDRRIPNLLVSVVLISGLAFSYHENGIQGIKISLQSIGIAFGLTILPYITKNFSAGDVKLLISIGVYYDIEMLIIFLLIFYLLTLLVGILVLIKARLKNKKIEAIPFAPIITLSFFCFIGFEPLLLFMQ